MFSLFFFSFAYWYISHLKIVLPQLRDNMEGYRNEHCVLQKSWAHLPKRKGRRQQVHAGAVMHSSALGQHYSMLFHPSQLASWRNQPGFNGAGTQMSALDVTHSPEQGEMYRRDVQAAPPDFLLPHGVKAKNYCWVTFASLERPLNLLPGPSSGLYAMKWKH